MGGLIVFGYVLCYLEKFFGLIFFGLVMGVLVMLVQWLILKVLVVVVFMMGMFELLVEMILCDFVVVVVYVGDLLVILGKVLVCIVVELVVVLIFYFVCVLQMKLLLLIQYGGQDIFVLLVDNCVFYDLIGLFDKMVWIYEGFYYEIYNEFEWEMVFDDFFVWLVVYLVG